MTLERSVKLMSPTILPLLMEMALKPEVPIPSGVVAQLGTKLAGGGVINLVPPAYINGFLKPGSTLSLIPSTDIQSLLESANSILKDLAIITGKRVC